MKIVFALLFMITRLHTNDGIILSKCCDKNEIFSLKEERCFENMRDENLNDIGKSLVADTIDDEKFDWEYNFFNMFSQGHIECLDLILVEDNVTIDKTGLLNIEGYPPSHLYCLDTIKDSGDENLLILRCSKDVRTVNEPSETTKIWRNVFSSFSILSSVSLFVTFVVYIIVPGLLNFQGVLVLCNLITMFLASLYILAVFNMRFSLTTCSVIGFFGYFISLSMFLWMTVTCVDIYITLTRQNQVSNYSKDSKKWKFSLYVSITWGFAFLITLFLLTLQTFVFSPESEWNPRVGETMCFLQSEGYSRLVFFHVPILVLISGNLILFLIIMIRLKRERKQTRMVRVIRRQSTKKCLERNTIEDEIRKDFVEQSVCILKRYQKNIKKINKNCRCYL